MCGLAGVFAYAPSAGAVDRAELRRVRDHMRARGPDGEGEWFSLDGRVGLAHRRLAIIDLSERAAQPMRTTDGRFVITYNGEIYNYAALRSELEAQGVVFTSRSDTEVILQLYAKQGEAMLRKLRGMFAIAIWDTARRELFLARDPFGIKPLYYADDGRNLRFASQVKALLQSSISRDPEPAGHVGYFIWGSVPEPWTLFRSIRALPAGTWMRATEKCVEPPRVFASASALFRGAAANPARCTRDEAKQAIAGALRDTVAAHHVADVPVGIFLSSGLDSTLLAHLAPQSPVACTTITLGFDEFRGTEQDEVPLAAEVARTLETRHTTMNVSRKDFLAEREKLFAAMDQPSIDGVNSWFVSRAASQMGLKVAISGVGGDEVFASYPSFRDVPRIRNLITMLPFLRRWGKPLRRLSSPIIGRLTSPKYASLGEYGGSCGGAYLLRRALYLPWELDGELLPNELAQGLEALGALRDLNATCEKIHCGRLSVTALETNWYMKNQLLRDTDWASMAHSLEVRTPFVDWEFVSLIVPFIAAHPSLAKAECFAVSDPSIPESVLRKRKTGFVVPVQSWLNASAEPPQERRSRAWSHMVYKKFAETAAT